MKVLTSLATLVDDSCKKSSFSNDILERERERTGREQGDTGGGEWGGFRVRVPTGVVWTLVSKLFAKQQTQAHSFLTHT